jgi:pimeloyl-ACP methyl ester carboxylesterase
MIYLAILIIALLIVSLVPVLVIIVGPKMLLMPDRRKSEYYLQKFGFNHPSQMGLRHEEGIISTKEGFSLSYWEVDDPNCRGTKGVVVFLHGITDRKESGLNYAKELAELCQKMYLVDMRRHGDSEGKYCTYGYYEKHDVVKLIDKINSEKPGLPITLLGTSMGAAIAIQVAAIDRRVSRVIAVAPFYDLFSIALDHEHRHLGIRNEFLLRSVFRRAERIADFDTAEVSPAKDMNKIHVPILIVHGELDKTVKHQYPERLAELNDRAELLSIKGAGHVDVLEKGGKAFVEKISEFLSSPA